MRGSCGKSVRGRVVITQRGHGKETRSTSPDPRVSVRPGQEFSTNPVSFAQSTTMLGRNRWIVSWPFGDTSFRRWSVAVVMMWTLA